MDTLPLNALLVGIQLPKVTDSDCDSSLAELGRLVHTLGYVVVGSLRQKRNSTSNALVVGEGKLQEIAKWTGGTGIVASSVTRKKSKAAERFDASTSEDEDVSGYDPPESEPSELPAEGVRAKVVIFDCDLTPSQLRNLESATGAIVLDRTGVIQHDGACCRFKVA